MIAVSIVPTDGWHVVALADHLRPEEKLGAEALGVGVRRALWRSFRGSLYAKTAFIGGDIAAILGLGGDALSDEGHPWLATALVIETMPIAFARVARQEVQLMLDIKPRLVNWLPAACTRSCRFLEILGFTVEPPVAYGPLAVPHRRYLMSR